MKADKIIKEVQSIKTMYGDNVEVDVGDDYYACRFNNSIGQFKFLVHTGKLHKPFALSYEGEETSKAIELLQEV